MISAVTLIISRYCNLHCPFCLSSSGNVDISNEVPIKDVLQFVDSLKTVERLKVTGGEPLSPIVLPRTTEVAKYCAAKHIELQINTNGTHEVPDFKTSYQVSLDGLQETHDSIRGIGCFNKVVAFIITAKRMGLNVSTMTVITDKNVNQFKEIVSFTKSLGVQAFFQVVSSTGRAKNSSVDFDRARIITRINNYVHPGACKELLKECSSNLTTQAGQTIGIDEKGNIIPCPFLKRFKFGTIYTFNEEDVRLRMREIKHITCSNQEDYYV
jgi:MoaA/NifB/PqqE/SkfB family radical SAM enzyme